MPAMENKGAAQSAGRGEESKPGGSGNEERRGGKSGASGGAGAGGIAALNAEALGGYPQGSKGTSGLSPAAQIAMSGTAPGTYASMMNSPLGIFGIPGVGAPMAQPPAQGGQLARNTVGSGMTPANAYGQVGIAGEKGAAPSAFPEYFAGQLITPAMVGEMEKYGMGAMTDPSTLPQTISGTLPEEVAYAMNQAALGQANNQYLAQLQGGTPPTGATPTQMVTPGRMMPQVGAMETRAALGQYSPSATPTPQQPVRNYVGSGATPLSGEPYLNYALAAQNNASEPVEPVEPVLTQAGINQMEQAGLDVRGISPGSLPTAAEIERMLQTGYADPAFSVGGGASQTQAPAPAPAPAPAQPQMSTQEIAQNAAATSGTMPVTSYPVPTGSAVPGGGIMAGIQEALGAFGLGNLSLGNLNLGDFADTRTSEERLADFVSSQAEMSQGDDRTPVAPMFDDFGNPLPGSNSGDTTTTTPTPPPVTTPYVPNIPAPYYTPSTLSPYVPATAPTNPVYGYSSYNALQQAMGMAQGGAVRPSMTNAFAPGTYYARYNPYARGLGALRKG